MRRQRPLCLLLLLLLCHPSCGAASDGSSSNSNGSPTGTFFAPRDGPGYVALDEACEMTDDPAYLQRFETPMFRSVAERNGVTFLVDGTLLWSVRLNGGTSPERITMQPLPGHPLQLATTGESHLLVAAGEAGLLSVDVRDATTPEVVSGLELPSAALDVAEASGLALVAAGDEGLIVVDATDIDNPTVVTRIKVPGFAVAVDIEGDLAYVAGCKALSVVDISHPEEPALLGSYWVPHGHAKDVDAVGTDVYVAGGEALFAYDAQDASMVLWKGYYAEPEVEGFYVNAVVVRDGMAYIAAGDESVRSVDLGMMPSADGYPAMPVTSEEPPVLDGPEVLPDNDLRTEEWIGQDPIGIGLAGDLLFVLGNFRWMGERTLKIMQVGPPGHMEEIGAYIQPDAWIGLKKHQDHLVLLGDAGQLALRPIDQGTEIQLQLPEAVERAESRPDGLFLLTDGGRILRYRTAGNQLNELLIDTDMEPFDLAMGESLGFVSDWSRNAIRAFDPDENEIVGTLSVSVGFPGWSHLLAHGDFLYAYDWIMGLLHTFNIESPYAFGHVSTQRIGLCEAYDIADFYNGTRELRTLLRAEDDHLYLLCPSNENGQTAVLDLELSDPGEPDLDRTIRLPAGRYVDLAVRNGQFFAATFDNNVYRSTLTWFTGHAYSAQSWLGHANGLVLHGDVAYVIDGDAGLLTFRLDRATAAIWPQGTRGAPDSWEPLNPERRWAP